MKKINKKLFKILILSIIFQVFFLINVSEAGFWSDIFRYGDNFLKKGAEKAENILTDPNDPSIGATDENMMKIINDLYSILFPLGVVITVIVGGVLGIKFMLASAEDKAKVKESMIPYVVGCIVIYGAFGIWKICIEIFSNLS